jgi:hypothetical protein
MSLSVDVGLGPTPQQLRVMAAYVRIGSQKGVAAKHQSWVIYSLPADRTWLR